MTVECIFECLFIVFRRSYIERRLIQAILRINQSNLTAIEVAIMSVEEKTVTNKNTKVIQEDFKHATEILI